MAAVLLTLIADDARTMELQHNIRFQRIGFEDGLTQETIYQVLQDHRGLVWLATQEGLNRYDGNAVTPYLHDPESADSLSNDWVWSLAEDNRGTLWIGTDGGGLNELDPVTGGFRHFRHDPASANSLLNDAVRVVTVGADGRLWLGTDGGLSVFDPDNATFQNFAPDPDQPGSLGGPRVRAVLHDRRGMVWVGTDGQGVSLMDVPSGTFRHFRHAPNNSNTISSDRVRSLYQTNDGMIWIGTYDAGLNRYNPRTDRVTRYRGESSGLESDFVRELLQDHRGVMWAATDNGLHEYRPESDTFLAYTNDLTNPYSLADNRVTTLYQDRGNVLWVGTYAGLNTWNYRTIAFRLFRSSETNGLSNDTILAFSESADGVWWVGTYDGLYRYDGSGMFQKILLEPLKGLESSPVTALANDGSGALWVGTRRSGLLRHEPATGRWRHYAPDPSRPGALAAGGVTSLDFRDDQLWVGTYGGGLHHYRPQSDDFFGYRHDPERVDSPPSDRVVSVRASADGRIWMGTLGSGAAILDPASGLVQRLTGSAADATIWSIHEDREQNIWMGTQGDGLLLLPADQRDRPDPLLRSYGRGEGLRSLVVYGVLSDDQRNIWMSSNQGIARLVPESDQIRHFDIHHGLQSYEFNAGALLRTRRGELLFGGSNGFNAFFPSEVQVRQYPPPVTLTNIFKVNQPVRASRSLGEFQSLEVGTSDYLVTFEFVALDYAVAGGHSYEYRMTGYDPDWIRAGNVRRASYTNLPPGDYRFQVRAAGESGIWSDRMVDLPVTVLRLWYRSQVALIGFLLLAGLGIWLLWRAGAATAAAAVLPAGGADLRSEAPPARSIDVPVLWDEQTGLASRAYAELFLVHSADALVRRLERLPLSAIQEDHPRLFLLSVQVETGEAGSEQFLTTARALKAQSRAADLLCRWGERQILLAGESTMRNATETVAVRVARQLSELDEGDPGRFRVALTFFPIAPHQPHVFSLEQTLALLAMVCDRVGAGQWLRLDPGPTGLARQDLEAIVGDPERAETRGFIRFVHSPIATIAKTASEETADAY